MKKQYTFSLLVAKNVVESFYLREYLSIRVYAKVYKNLILSQKILVIKRLLPVKNGSK
jgi:hypothetical protein